MNICEENIDSRIKALVSMYEESVKNDSLLPECLSSAVEIIEYLSSLNSIELDTDIFNKICDIESDCAFQ